MHNCEHKVDYLDVEFLVDAPGFVASVGCPNCGERLRRRVTIDPRAETPPVAEYHEDDGDHVLVDPDSFGSDGTTGAWLKIDIAPFPLELML